LLGRSIDYLFFHAHALIWLLRNASSPDTVVICTDPPLLSVTCAIALKIKGATMVNWIMDLFPETAVQLGFFRRWRALARWVASIRNRSLGTPGITVCPTEKMADYLARNGIPRNRLVVMHHASDAEEIRPIESHSNEMRRQWGLSSKFVVGYSGNFGRAHEFDTIIEAARRLQHHPDICFLLIGGGNRHGDVLEKVQRLKLQNVIFKPLQPSDKLAESLSVADVHLVSLLPELEHCIVPSKFYGILAAGRPTIFIGDPDGEVARVVMSKGCGISVEIGAAQQLSQIISALHDQPALCAEMGRTARQLLLTDYSREAAVDGWAALFERLQNQRPAAIDVVHQGASS
jgi:glycosyltransferase involved in cell wall biosynthesis